MKTKIKNQAGMSMIEVLVTIVITSVALLGLAALLTKSMQSTFDASQRTTAVWAANDFVERYRIGISSDKDVIKSQVESEHDLVNKLAGQNVRAIGREEYMQITWNCTSCKNNVNQQNVRLLLNNKE
ncbi:type IV pilus modification protein PilV [Zooshikella harenae]|uniref:Type IV pilus modification protein PilV n=1 Tax=Zooshikella harenae TaxID=2827238 RepID=A0ABS5Z7X6_9GAMM|nr:type IV pilus modification protein PilV [Zooshikella harenae]MBU2710150.1 type IV pilus modification protein PilV [Zooshikella harenae]